MESITKTFLKRLNQDPKYYGFWGDFRKYCNDFDILNKEYFVESLPLMFNRIKNDGASYTIYESLKKYAFNKPKEAIEVLELIEKKGTLEALEFSSSILVGLSQSKMDYLIKDKILSFINSSDENRINSGIRAAIQVIIKDKIEEEEEFLSAVHQSLNKVIESKSSKNLGIITRFYNKYLNSIANAKEIIIKLLELKNIEVQNEVARSLNEEFKLEEDPVHFQNCLTLLSFTEAKYKGVYGTIRYRLEDITTSQPNIIVEFIHHWILNNKGNLKNISILKEIIHDLYSKHPKNIETLFLNWLNSDNISQKIALQFVISDLSSNGVDSVGLPKDVLKDLSETDSLYVVFMIVGHILDRKYATEMLYNILEVNFKNARIRNHIASLFVNYLIINYYSVTDILKRKRGKANKIINSIIDQIIDASEKYYKEVSDLETINEFEPSDKRMSYFLKQQNVQMQKLMNESESKNDSFLSMLTNINLRAGKSFFSKYRGEYSQESEMQNFRSSVEVARIQYIDEIGQMKLRLMWQNMKRNELPN